MDIYYDIFNNLLHHLMAETEEEVTQKWIKLSLIKSVLRYGLMHFENSISNVPFEDRLRIQYQFLELKNLLWQAVGAIHGNIASTIMPSVIEVKTSVKELHKNLKTSIESTHGFKHDYNFFNTASHLK